MDRKLEDVPLASIPLTLESDIMRIIEHYTVGFLRIKKGLRGDDLILLGSGTLVTVNGIHAILTAHHVVQQLPRSGKLGLVYSARRTHLTIAVDGLQYMKIARGTVDADGPDLGAVILPAPVVSTLKATKSFHNLDRNRTELLAQPPALNRGVWVVQGFIGKRTKEHLYFERRVKRIIFHELCSSGIVIPYTKRFYDYFKFPIKYAKGRSIPRDYGGTSGGGLWQVPLEKRRSSGQITPASVPILSGVAFYQEPTKSRRTALRCHGRRGVYEVAYEAISQTSAAK
jgi:hypothetical protein